ncbi:MAG: threonylcarbamoyl-AMP synthase [Gammaproteobacteria bacterium]|jgi:L-threonylcarbamoyladenylate synthase|nr:threonylcarbamoyl-AMP synthase [Gammaproteobacteria bacterium]MBT4462270.1 threonylcarbamoyl-AMP synthase [Gammaproteobacteria bacterium]MBT4655197.1 threonylcarbamoyl-AMP synthase [Gammaproteobacteria bacterium]MBT5116980.1 threonylcarbamoyl-AMP synthase [Gammaproteobacteria bacterium]MBT5762014.1 threonylcarbamoyl-AMP synthase [Gammaproteobacteria bacterium]
MIVGSPENAVELLSAGHVIGYPTEAVFGLGCDPWNKKAVTKIANIKKRHIGKPFLLVASNINQLTNLIDTDIVTEKAKLSWPGHTTWLIPSKKNVPVWLLDEETKLIGIRVSDHPVIKRICNGFNGPIISTSANLSGEVNIKDQHIFISKFENKVDYLVEGNIGNHDNPSVIINMETNENIR